MAQRKSRGALQWIRTAGAAAIVAAGIGTAIYLWTQSSSQSQTDDNQGKSVPKTKGPSKAIIITESVAREEGINWINLLQEDVVLLVPPGVSFLEDRAGEESPAHRYKIIRCDTLMGLWSCVKHLQKEQLLYVEEEIANELPSDLTRYVKKLISCTSSQQLKASCV
ncbi:hypothetical protein ZYGR_0AI00270 [Zygosaccharomyces rouxii]|uniref:Peroxisome assembly protein 22 n=1 Tax=Zygosaccharomyces rouxii TaxID=4956 RepID=A0A1Q3AAM3_ZYGRO|nr:hypothetical protein ZYGR_0AI00270 [Zygosaccharomyces rouxii]